MKTKRKKLLAFALCASMLTSLLAGCAGGGSSSTADSQTESGSESAATGAPLRDTLNIAYNAQPNTFDPHSSAATAVAEIDRLVYESLFEMDENGEPQPQLCESYEASADNKEWTFKLRQGVKFHNGEEMKAKDVCASLNRWAQKFSAVPKVLTDGEKFEEVDDYTVKLTLKNPSVLVPYLLGNFSQKAAIMPASVIEAHTTNDNLKPEEIVGTGSYKFSEWVVDSYVKLEKFDDYKPFTTEKSGSWGDRTASTPIIMIHFVTDTNTRLNGLESGEYDIAASIAYSDVDRLKGMEGVTMMTDKFNALTLIMNKSANGNSLCKNEKFRQAIGYAINPDEIMEGAIPSTSDYTAYDANKSDFPTNSPWYVDVGTTYKQDKEKAKALLKEAGYNGEPFRMMSTEAYPEFYNATLIVKQELEDVGIKVDFQVYDWGTMLGHVTDPTSYDAYPMNYPFAVSPVSVLYLMSTKNSGFTDDAKLNELTTQLQAQPTLEDAEKFWKETVQPYCIEQTFTVKCGDYDYVYGVSDKVKGFKPYYGLALWGVSVEE